jgi:hypothetical protein
MNGGEAVNAQALVMCSVMPLTCFFSYFKGCSMVVLMMLSALTSDLYMVDAGRVPPVMPKECFDCNKPHKSDLAIYKTHGL